VGRRDWAKAWEHFKAGFRCWLAAITEQDQRTRGILVRFGFTLVGRGIALTRGHGQPRALAGAGFVQA
jgi:hypothetical protein